MNQKTKKICIIGGGVSGLTLAFRLYQISKQRKIPSEIHLLEKSGRIGGIIDTEHKDGFTIEKGPDGFLQQKKSVRDLATDLNIDQQIITTKPSNRRSMILAKNSLIEIPDGFYLMAPSKIFPFLRSPLLSWSGKIRTLMEFFVPRKKHSVDESLESFVKRRFGKENLEKISQAMLGGIYTADPKNLSMQAALPRFVEMEKKYGSITKGILHEMSSQKNISGARYGLFGSFQGGMQTLIHAIDSNVPKDMIHLNTNINQVRHDHRTNCWNVVSNFPISEFDVMCITVAPREIPKFFPSIIGEEQKVLESIPYASSAIFNVAYKADQIKNKPNCVGFIVPQRENKHFIACSFISDKYEHRAPEGFHLLRLFIGGATQENILHIPVDELKKIVLGELSKIIQIEGEPVLEDFKVWPKSMPQYTLGHVDRVQKIRKIFEKCPNFYLLGNGYQGVGLPDLVEQAKITAEKIFS